MTIPWGELVEGCHEIARYTAVNFGAYHESTYHQNRTALSLHGNIYNAYYNIRRGPQGESWTPYIGCENLLLVYAIGLKEIVKKCHLAYEWFSGNLQITLMTANYVI